MQRLEVSGAVRLIYKSLGVKGLRYFASTETSVESQVLVNRVSIARTIFTACVKRVGRGIGFRLVIKVSGTCLPHPWNLQPQKL